MISLANPRGEEKTRGPRTAVCRVCTINHKGSFGRFVSSQFEFSGYALHPEFDFIWSRGRQLRQAASSLDGGTNWVTLTNIALSASQPYIFTDTSALTNSGAFYRAVPDGPGL